MTEGPIDKQEERSLVMGFVIVLGFATIVYFFREQLADVIGWIIHG